MPGRDLRVVQIVAVHSDQFGIFALGGGQMRFKRLDAAACQIQDHRHGIIVPFRRRIGRFRDGEIQLVPAAVEDIERPARKDPVFEADRFSGREIEAVQGIPAREVQEAAFRRVRPRHQGKDGPLLDAVGGIGRDPAYEHRLGTVLVA